MKILYIHGYGGSKDGSTSQLIRSVRAADEVFAPQFDYKHPDIALNEISQHIKSYNPDVIVASSLGALYLLQKNCGIHRVLINPALPQNLINIDNDESFIKALEQLEIKMHEHSLEMVDFIFGLKDEVAPNMKYFMDKYLGNPEFRFHTILNMGHELSKQGANGMFNNVMDVISWEVRLFGSEKDYTNENIDC